MGRIEPDVSTVLTLVGGIALSIVGLASAAAVSYAPPVVVAPRVLSVPLPPPIEPMLPLPDTLPMPMPAEEEPADPVHLARAALIAIAQPGGTMSRIGREKAIGWLHPEYALRAARAAKRARAEGIAASCASAYRPYGLGVGGFKNKRHSRHTFGTACDWTGIGKPGSRAARRFHVIASQEGLCNPYGPNHRAEWNHYQLGCRKLVPLAHPVQRTVSAKGPIDPEQMWRLTNQLLGGVTDTLAFGLASARSVVALAPPAAKTSKVAKRKTGKRPKTRYARRGGHRT